VHHFWLAVPTNEWTKMLNEFLNYEKQNNSKNRIVNIKKTIVYTVVYRQNTYI